MARLYANENFPLPVVEELRLMGHDVVTIQEMGTAGQALRDEQVLSFAATQGRALLTLNRKHFVRLHSAHPAHAGVIVCSFDRDFTGQAKRIHAAIILVEDLSGQLLRVDRPVSPAEPTGP